MSIQSSSDVYRLEAMENELSAGVDAAWDRSALALDSTHVACFWSDSRSLVPEVVRADVWRWLASCDGGWLRS